IVRVIGEIGVGVALDDGEAPRHALADSLARDLDTAPVDAALAHEQREQRPVAAADVEHPRPRLDHVGDEPVVGANRQLGREGRRRVHGHRPRARAAAARKPPVVAKSSGSSSRKASCPLSLSISTKLTEAPAALSAWTTAREPEVGNSQSEVKDATQKRVFVPRKALASTPPWSAARSK